MAKKYRLEYLPAALRDMTEIVKYIGEELLNPSAAEKLIEDMIAAADKLRDFPYANAVHPVSKPLKYEYRKLIVKNYIMFYRVDENEKTVVITRVVYMRRDYGKLL